jgi:hypothetical protein
MFAINRLVVLFLVSIVTAGVAPAQRVAPGAQGERRGDPAARRVLERRFRERFEQVLKQRLALSDSQLARVIEVNARLDARRRELFTEERSVRKDMRDAIKGGDDAASQQNVAQLLERAMRVQRSRLDLVETEQRELATFLTPLQRAKYLGLQEQLRRRVDDMRRRAAGDSADDPFGEGPPRDGAKRRRPGQPPVGPG